MGQPQTARWPYDARSLEPALFLLVVSIKDQKTALRADARVTAQQLKALRYGCCGYAPIAY